MSTIETVSLKNGSEEAAAAVKVAMMVLRNLFDEFPTMAYELIMLCRDPNHEVWDRERTLKFLQARALVDASGSVHGTLRNIMNSAVTGNGLDMTIGNPVEAREDAKEPRS